MTKAKHIIKGINICVAPAKIILSLMVSVTGSVPKRGRINEGLNETATTAADMIIIIYDGYFKILPVNLDPVFLSGAAIKIAKIKNRTIPGCRPR